MPKPKFGKVALEGVQSILQHNSERGLRDLPGSIITQGALLEGLEVTTSGLRVAHKLGRRPRGWFIVDADANATVWRTDWDTNFLFLDASATVNVSLWVF